MVEIAVRRVARTLSRCRRGSRATRRGTSATDFSQLAVAARVARAWQSPDGTVTIRSEPSPPPRSSAGCSRSTTTTPSSCGGSRNDPLLGRATVHLRGLRPVRTATVAQALLRAVCGQLIDAKTARGSERRVIRALRAAYGGTGLCEPPSTAALGARRAVRAAPARAARAARRRARPALPLPRARAAPRRADRGGRLAGSSASAASGRGRPASSASRGSAATSTGSSATSASSSSCARPRPRGRGVGDGGAARAVRRVGRPRERLPPHRLRPRPGPAAGRPRGLGASAIRPAKRAIGEASAVPTTAKRPKMLVVRQVRQAPQQA